MAAFFVLKSTIQPRICLQMQRPQHTAIPRINMYITCPLCSSSTQPRPIQCICHPSKHKEDRSAALPSHVAKPFPPSSRAQNHRLAITTPTIPIHKLPKPLPNPPSNPHPSSLRSRVPTTQRPHLRPHATIKPPTPAPISHPAIPARSIARCKCKKRPSNQRSPHVSLTPHIPVHILRMGVQAACRQAPCHCASMIGRGHNAGRWVCVCGFMQDMVDRERERGNVRTVAR
jgi:hypothetical protein